MEAEELVQRCRVKSMSMVTVLVAAVSSMAVWANISAAAPASGRHAALHPYCWKTAITSRRHECAPTTITIGVDYTYTVPDLTFTANYQMNGRLDRATCLAGKKTRWYVSEGQCNYRIESGTDVQWTLNYTGTSGAGACNTSGSSTMTPWLLTSNQDSLGSWLSIESGTKKRRPKIVVHVGQLDYANTVCPHYLEPPNTVFAPFGTYFRDSGEGWQMYFLAWRAGEKQTTFDLPGDDVSYRNGGHNNIVSTATFTATFSY